MYDIFIFRGHGNGDCGAVGNGYTEEQVAQLLVNLLVKKLRSRGVNVHTNASNQNNYQNCCLNQYKYKFGYSIHLNSASSSASGIEAYVPLGEKYLKLEEDILKQVSSKLNIPNRGVKSRNYDTEQISFRQNGSPSTGKDYYKEIREAWQKGISLTILEVGFINSNDVHKIMQYQEEITTIMANVILKELGKEPLINNASSSKPNTTTQQDVKYQVVAGSFSNKENAQKQVETLKAKGVDSFIQVANVK